MTRFSEPTVVLLALALLVVSPAAGQQPQPGVVASIPLVRGLTIISALQFPEGDRENVVQVVDSTADGVRYTWRYREKRTGGGKHDAEFSRIVRVADLATAPRLNTIFTSGNPSSPGFTSFSISTATYEKVNTGASTPFSYTALEGGGELGKALGQMGGLFSNRVVMRGTLERVDAAPQTMPLLIDGRRVSVPALHLKGRFAFQEQRLEPDIWVLADRAHPLLLRIVTGSDVLQVVRIELPSAAAALEQALASDCAAELSGIHFAFASAELEPGSAHVLAAVAQMLERHTDWTLSIEGHTDNVGSAAANAELSHRRAQAVRNALLADQRVAAARLSAVGYGAARPRESNGTLEGRARNRRVELVRPCTGRGATR